MQIETCDAVHVVNQMRPGGIETMVFDIVRHSRNTSRIFSLEGRTDELVGNWPALASISGAIEGFGKKNGLAPALVLKIAQRLRELKPRAVYLHRNNPLLYGGLAARIARVPVVVHVEHDIWQYSDPGRRRLLEWSVRMVRPVHFAVSPAIAEALQKMLPAAQVRVVPGGIDLDRYRQRERGPARIALGLPADADVIGTAGRLEPVKGHRVLVEAMQHLSDTAHVVIVGDGSQRASLLARARELGVEARLHLLGHRDDLELILPAFDVFCLPSLGEGLPRVLMEAQSADIRVVASDVGSVRQAVDPATGQLVAAGNAAELAKALKASLAAPAKPGDCRAFATARYGIDRLVHEYDSIAGLPVPQ